MAIKGSFRIASEIIEVIINGNDIMFLDENNTITTMDGLKISKEGTLKEFPDLKNNEEWKKLALERLKEHLKKLENNKKKLEYIKEELTKFGYEALFYQEAGHRPKKFK